MTAATTTLPLFWNLASAKKGDRIDASVKLVSALQQFQDCHILESSQKQSSPDNGDEVDDGEYAVSEDNEDAEFESYSASLDTDNAADVAYAIRRLIRGLASPRESSRLGFAVALTELLSRIDAVTCEQVLVLLKNASQTSGSMSGQEERDMLFARLFGLKAVIQSGLLFNRKPLRSSSTSSSSLRGFECFLKELVTLGDKKSWLRESCWWTLLSAVNELTVSDVPWKENAYNMLFHLVYVNDRSWSPEKIALTLKLQKALPDADWQVYCASYFKDSGVLSISNLPSLGRLLKESLAEDLSPDGIPKFSAGPWKPQLHFVWDVILDALLSPERLCMSTGSFQDFYRIVIDENLFASSSSPQRKYWGFLVFQKSLQRLPSAHLPMLFTKNFMRTWINQLSKNDRYLHKIARQVASDVLQVVEKDPKSGFMLVLQLTGTNGSFHFDRITKTKTMETIIANMDNTGIKEYILYLFEQVNDGEKDKSFATVDARRAWIIDQMAALVRRTSIPKTDESVQLILIWLTTHAFFKVIKKSPKSSNAALRLVPEPAFSDNVRNTAKMKLLSCLGDLTNVSGSVGTKQDGKVGEFWISRVLKTIVELEKDTKHVEPLRCSSEEVLETRNHTFSATEKIKASIKDHEPAHGVELLLNALTLKCLCDDEHEADWEGLRECADVSMKLFVLVGKPEEKRKKTEFKPKDDNESTERPPIDLIVDFIIGLLEHSTIFTRVVANQSFSMLTPMVTASTVDLILAQLERRDPNEEVMDADTDGDDETGDSEQEESENSNKENDEENGHSGPSEEEEDEAGNDEDTESLRKALQAAVSGKEAGVGSDRADTSDETSMDDEQMMAIDEKLAAVFRTKAEERKKGKDAGAQREATFFKNRVLDLVETFMKKQPSNTLVLRFILPLVELVATASSDEKQLSDKAKGILSSRLSTTKHIAPVEDVPNGVELLEALHSRARRAHSQETVSVVSICSLFVTKALISVDEQAVLRIYKESITDFIARKASSLNSSFVVDFIRRHPIAAWSMKSHIVAVLGNAVNGYRQSQAFSIIQTVLTSLPQADSKKEEIMSFIPDVSAVFLDTLNKSCVVEKPIMSAGHVSDVLEVAKQLCRFSRRFTADPAALKQSWTPERWEELASALLSSERFKASTSLAKLCRQISERAQWDGSKDSTKDEGVSARKRKQEGEDVGVNEDETSSRRRKRKKVRKIPKAGSG